MAIENVIDSVAAKQAAAIFEQIACDAYMLEEMCSHIAAGNSADELETRVWVLRSVINRMGWRADLGSEKLGCERLKGGAEQWLMPPAYLDIQAAPEGPTLKAA